MRFPANGFWAFCQAARPAPPIGLLTTPPPALAWFPLVWPGFGPPQGGFPANARGRSRPHPRGPVPNSCQAPLLSGLAPAPAGTCGSPPRCLWCSRSQPQAPTPNLKLTPLGMTASSSPLAKISSYDHSPLFHHALRCYISSRCCRPRVLRRLAAPLDER